MSNRYLSTDNAAGRAIRFVVPIVYLAILFVLASVFGWNGIGGDIFLVGAFGVAALIIFGLFFAMVITLAVTYIATGEAEIPWLKL